MRKDDDPVLRKAGNPCSDHLADRELDAGVGRRDLIIAPCDSDIVGASDRSVRDDPRYAEFLRKMKLPPD